MRFSFVKSLLGVSLGRLFDFYEARIGARSSATISTVLLASLLLTGCSKQEQEADFVVVNGPEPESLDPAIITGQAEGRIVRCLFEGLVRLDPKTASPIPGIAERWDLLD